MLVVSWRCLARALRVPGFCLRFALPVIFLLVLTPFTAHAEDVRYYFDEAGRLIQTTTPAGSVQYRYDSLGNIVEVVRVTATNPAISEFTPNAGPVGTTVTIIGQGFSPVPASNLVKFNGQTATVLSAAANAITAVVPAGATTGKISVKVGTKTATSLQDFVVTADQPNAAPQIAGFSPHIGEPGATVTITGRGFVSRSETSVRLNGNSVPLVSVSDTQIVFTVPPGIGGGKIKLSNRYGYAESADDFYVVPVQEKLADIAYTARMSLDGPLHTVPTLPPGKAALLLFDATQNQWVGMGFTSTVTSAPDAALVYAISPRATDLLRPIALNGDWGSPAERALISGTQTLVLRAAASSALETTVTLSSDLQGVMQFEGPASVFSSTRVAQNGSFSFSALKGEYVGLAVTGQMTPTNQFVAIYFRTSDGLIYSGSGCPLDTTSISCDIGPLPSTDIYSLVVDPINITTANLNVLLSRDVLGVLQPNGPAQVFNTSRAGQNARYSFDGVAGEGISVAWTGNSFASGYVLISAPAPSGQTWYYNLQSALPQGVIEIPSLPATGTYTVVVNPLGQSTGQIAVSLINDVTDTLIVDGPPKAISLTSSQNGRYVFNGVQNQTLGLGISDLLTVPAWGTVAVTVSNPDGSLLLSCGSIVAPGNSCDLPPLPATGAYTVTLNPTGLNAVQLTLTLSNDIEGALVSNEAAQNFSTARVGQNARYSFQGTAGDGLSLLVTGNTFSNATVQVRDPGGRSSPHFAYQPDVAFDYGTLPVDGTYTVFISPVETSVGQMQLAIKKDDSGSLAIDAVPKAINLAPGQNGRYTFTGTQNQALGLGVTGLTTDPDGRVYLHVMRTDNGNTQTYCPTLLAPGGSCDVSRLPVGGAYTVLVNPSGLGSSSMNLLLSSDVGGSAMPPGATHTFSSSRVGRNARYSFDVPANENVSVTWTGNTFDVSESSIEIESPNGSAFSLTHFGGMSEGSTTPIQLGAGSGYSVFVNPRGSATGQVSVMLQMGRADLTLPAAPSVGPIQIVSTGFDVPISYEAGNSGGGIAHSPWVDLAYLSADNILDASDRQIGLAFASANQGTGSVNRQMTLSIPPETPSGPATVILVVDRMNDVQEDREDNNTRAFSVALPTKPDVRVSALTASNIRVSAVGDYRLDMSATVVNAGATAAGDASWHAGFYLSADAVLDDDDFLLTSTTMNRLLPAGTQNLAETLKLPLSTPAGNYFLLAKADAFAEVPESDETNNVHAVPITLRKKADLQLVVTSATPDLATDGSYSVPATFTVTNIGGYVANSAPWYDEAFLSSDAVLDTSDVYLGQSERSTNLNAGSSYTVSGKRYQLPAGVNQGNHTLFIKTDARHSTGFYVDGDRVIEESEGNNVVAVPLSLGQKPDLAILDPVIGTPTLNTNGTYSIQVNFTVKNQGVSVANPTWYDSVYLSADGVLNTADDFLGQQVRSTSLAAGGTYAFSKKVDTPANPSGNYTLFLKTDGMSASGKYVASEKVGESNESNNVFSAPIALGLKADLVVANVNVGPVAVRSSGAYAIPVSFTIRNDGNAPALASWADAVYLSTDGTLDTNDLYLGQAPRSVDLAPGAEYEFSKTLVTSTTQAPGAYTLFMKADGTNSGGKYTTGSKVVESSETNNSASRAVNLPNR